MQKPLVAELLRKADEGNYAVGAFNFTDMTDIKAIVEAAEEEKAPMILLANWRPIVDYMGIEYLKNAIETAKEFSSVPYCAAIGPWERFQAGNNLYPIQF